ncbi:MAG: DnaJ domain-containing protein [Leptospiraceae bacterium]|nr:DnaJ domain-containing protein [Leptospiraceae bacterium]MCP5497182.1 DnaJ domain-containing protein [Leptospiraceae bacterium]
MSSYKKKTDFVDYYKILNVPFGSSVEIIKSFFRDKAKVLHPDNKLSGSSEKFRELLVAYKTLVDNNQRKNYDKLYLEHTRKETDNNSLVFFLLPHDRIVYTNSIAYLARRGLLRRGMRTKDWMKYTGVYHDIDILVKKEEKHKNVVVKIPLIVRILCPSCMGSDVFCSCCNGKGTYKSTRSLNILFVPKLLVHNKIYNIELSKFRPDKFIHFKKKNIKLRIEVV